MDSQAMPPRPQPATALWPAASQVMACLAACIAMQMTGYIMVLPLFARRFTELGADVGALGTSSMAYALTMTVCAPFMGALADRLGRRPVVLVSLAAQALTFTGYLLAPSAAALIALRGLSGALTAGLMPAATGMVADLAPENRRGRWIGILSGGASIGWIAGPVLGGLFYDRSGYAVALFVSIGMATLAFIAALAGIRETHLGSAKLPSAAVRTASLKGPLQTFQSGLPRSMSAITVVLLTCFAVIFAWALIEPRFMFYVYDDLGWSSSKLGLAMSTFGAACMLGEFGLSRLSDDLGRKPVILAGLVLFSAQFLGLALFRDYMLIVAAFVVAGLGNALFDPALSASVLDMTAPAHQARFLGLKSTVGSIGSILGPAPIVLSASLLQAPGVFLIAAGIVFLVAFIVLLDAKGLRLGNKALRQGLAAEPFDRREVAPRS